MKKIIYTFIFLAFASITNAQWVQMPNGIGNIPVISFAHSGNYIFAGTYNSGLYLSTNNGANWVLTSLTNRTVWSIAVSGSYLLAGTNMGVFRSANNGLSWTQTSLNWDDFHSLAVSGSNVFAGCTSTGVHVSTDNGAFWNPTILNNRSVNALAISGNYIFAGTFANGVYLSTNNGSNWTQTSFNNRTVYSLVVNGNNVFAGTYEYPNQGIYLSANNGTSWSQTSLNNRNVYSLASNGNNIFAGTDSFGVYVSNNNGTSWTQRNEGLGLISVAAFCMLDNYIFAGTFGVYRRPLWELIGIKTISKQIPSHYVLEQNYPNPFNPSTNIKFDVSKGSFVSLKVFDALGREVAILVNEDLKPGTYEADWDASSYPSGVYFYTIRTEGYTETKRMVLIK